VTRVRLDQIRTAAEYHMAMAGLERAVGVKLEGIAETSPAGGEGTR
jgi:hypothetical protein